MKLFCACTGLLLAALSFAPRAEAALITYELTGVASGKIGATTFTNAAIDLVGKGNTANIQTLIDPSLAFPLFANPFNTLTITIGGVGTATITDASEIFAIPQPVIDPQNQIPPLPIVVFGKTDNPPALDSITGIGANATFLLTGYNLATAIGPITAEGGIGYPTACGTPGHDPCLNTTLGALSFTTNGVSPDTPTTFTATLQPVPEPTTLLLVGGGLAMLRGRRSRVRAR